MSKIILTASPRVCLHDEISKISAMNLMPNYPYTIRAKTYDEKNRMFQSCAHFISDKDGKLDLTKDASCGGDYKGVLPMGLLVGLKAEPSLKMKPMFIRLDVNLPIEIDLSIHEGHLNNILESESLANVKLERHLMKEGVERIEIKEGRVRGTLFIPPGDGPFPGVIDLYGARVGIPEYRGCQLASRGIATFELAFFAYEGLPQTLEKFELEYFIEAIDVMCNHEKIISDKCGILSSCFSGQFGILIGNYVKKAVAVVISNGIISPFECVVTYKGQEISSNPYHPGNDIATYDENNFAILSYDMLKRDLHSKEHVLLAKDADPSTHFLLMGGSQCGLHTYVGHKTFEDGMADRKDISIERIVYPGAPHIIDPPYSSLSKYVYQAIWPAKPAYLNTPYKGIFVDHGGEAEGTYFAEEQAWEKMISFFNKHVAVTEN